MNNIFTFNEAVVTLYEESDIRDYIFEGSKTISKYLVVRVPIVKVQNNTLSKSATLIVKGDQNNFVEFQWQLSRKISNKPNILNNRHPLQGK